MTDRKKFRVKEWIEIIGKNAKSKGFHETHQELGTRLMLIVSELGEALEALRHNRELLGQDINSLDKELLESYPNQYKEKFEEKIKDTFEDELADAVIRIFDLCWILNIDLEFFMEAKTLYNELRPKLHGKEF